MTLLQITTETNRIANGDGAAVWQLDRYNFVAFYRDEQWRMTLFIRGVPTNWCRYGGTELGAALVKADNLFGELP